MGLSRLYLGVHFLSDVLGGHLIGLLWLVVGALLAESLRARRQAAAAPPPLSASARLVATAALIGLAPAFYITFALHYAPPLTAAHAGRRGLPAAACGWSASDEDAARFL